jgi:hypothetical protein
MIRIRALTIAAALLASLAIAACGGGGSGASPSPYGAATPMPTQAPAAGTNKPATSGDPYADYGY